MDTAAVFTKPAITPERQSFYDRLHTKLLGLSVDSVESHERWAVEIADLTGAQINFPLAIAILCIFPEIATWLPDHLMGVAHK